MKKIGILNHPISETIAQMGHYDMIVIGDAGLPIPAGVKRIDLALVKGVPGFVETLAAVLLELQVESVVLATETKDVSPALYEKITATIGNAPIEFVDHETLKSMSSKAVAVIRTGEFTPYANIILKSGVIF